VSTPLAFHGRPIIVGAGVAGLMTALELAPRPVVVLSKAPLGAEGSTLWAQGGMAAALGAEAGNELKRRAGADFFPRD